MGIRRHHSNASVLLRVFHCDKGICLAVLLVFDVSEQHFSLSLW
jgi:hypothetical protein